MDKAPQPNLLGLLLVIGIFAFLIWHGPVNDQPAKNRLPTIEIRPS